DIWCRVLRILPQAELVVLDVAEERSRLSLLDKLAQRGIDAERVSLRKRENILDYFATIGNVDIALDTFPYNGATTTLDTLWMGVPMVALAGSTTVGRSSFSLLSSLAAPELIATSSADLIARNVALASDPHSRRTLRRSLRSRLESSPLMDAQGFTRALEKGFRTMWYSGV